MAEHLADEGWRFDFDNAKSRFGACHYRTKKITLSGYLVPLNDEAEVRNTILHEIAHALAGAASGHGPEWKRVARSIGCTGDRCYDNNVVQGPQATYEAVCSCGIVHKRFRKSRRMDYLRCSLCHGHLLFKPVDAVAVSIVQYEQIASTIPNNQTKPERENQKMSSIKPISLEDLPVSGTRESKVSGQIFADMIEADVDLAEVNLADFDKPLASVRSTLSNYVQRHGNKFRVFTKAQRLFVERCENSIGVVTGEQAVKPRASSNGTADAEGTVEVG